MRVQRGASDTTTTGAVDVPLVFWDGYGLQNAHSGVGVHARCLATALRDLNGEAPTVIGPESLEAVWKHSALITLPRLPISDRLATSKLLLPLRVEYQLTKIARHRRRPMILHALSNLNLGAFAQCRSLSTVLTVHDLIPYLAPDSVSRTYQLQVRMLLPRALARADVVICVSQWTRRTLLERWPHLEAKTIVIPNGIAPFNADDVHPNRLRQGVSVKDALSLLYVARFETYKRLGLFLEILRRGGSRFRGHLITNALGKAWVTKIASDLMQQNRLQVDAAVDDKAYEAAMVAADVYVHTSMFEGFCLPAADAMRHGRPVVYQKGSAIDEVVGQAGGIGLGTDAQPDAWLDAIEDANRSSESSGYWEGLNLHLGQMHTWKDAARDLTGVYNDLAQGKSDQHR